MPRSRRAAATAGGFDTSIPTMLLSFARLPAEDGTYVISVSGVRDLSGIPVAEGSTVPFTIERQGSFYVQRAWYLGDGVVSVMFNAEPDSSLTSASFSSDPPLVFDGIEREGQSPGEVRLRLVPPWRVDGTVHTLSVSNACDVYGNEIQSGAGSQASLTLYAEDLLLWRVGPNPFRPDGSPAVLRFVGVPRDAVIGIWDLAGRAVQEIRESSPDGAIEWDGRSRTGSLLPSGVYIYRMESSLGRKTGRLVASR